MATIKFMNLNYANFHKRNQQLLRSYCMGKKWPRWFDRKILLNFQNIRYFQCYANFYKTLKISKNFHDTGKASHQYHS